MTTHPKRLYALVALLTLLFAVALTLTAFYFGDGAFGGAYLRPRLHVSVAMGDCLLLSEDGAETAPAGDTELLFVNKEEESIRLFLYQKNALLSSQTLAPGEEKSVPVSVPAEGDLSLVAEKNGAYTALVSDAASLGAVTEAMEDGGDLVFVKECALTKPSLAAPFRLFGLFSFDELTAEYSSDSPLVLSPSAPFEAILFVQAPSASVYYRNFTPSFSKEEEDYYLKAVSCNGHLLHPLSFPVSSEENLARLADETLLPRFSDGGTLSFIREFTVTRPLSFQGGAELCFSVPVAFGDAYLSFSSDRAVQYKVQTVYGNRILSDYLRFEAPLASLTWEGDGEIPALSTVTARNNLASYNGNPLTLGGEGTALPVLRLLKENHEFLEEDVVFSVSGNLLEGVFPYDVTKEDLASALPTLSAEGGTARLEGDLSDGVIITEDENGKKRRFGVAILRDGYNIPVVYLETENGAEITSKSQYINGTFSMDGGDSSYPDQKESSIRIRGRGNSSWKWEKKPYKIHFAEPISLLGLPAAEEWALFSNYADKSLFRNRLAQVMASTLSFDYNPTHVCVDVFLNGEYLGVYTLGEHLEEGEGRVEVDYDMASVDCGYFMEAGGVVSGVDVKGMNYFHAGLVKFVLIKGPEYNTLTSEQFAFIKEHLTKINELVKKGEGYEEYLDMDTVVDWLIMIELSNNTDCAWRRSTYLVKNPGEKIKMGPVWDFDLAFGNFSKDNQSYDTWASTTDDDYVGETWTTHFLKDPEFQKRFKARWEEVRDQLLKVAFDEIDSSYETLLPSANENFERWDILGRKVAFEPHSTSLYPTYESQIDFLKDFLEARAAWIDSQVENW